MYIHNFFGHLYTITAHRRKVIRHCFKAGIPFQGLTHDLSKYAPIEFFAGVKYYQGGEKSPNQLERQLYGYSAAWLHHKGRNRHHFEYWNDYNPKTKKDGPVKMPRKYLVEMFCDRMAACKVYLKDKYNDGSALEYFLNSKRSICMHPKTAKELEFLLRMLSDKGEKYTFKYIREHKNKDFPIEEGATSD